MALSERLTALSERLSPLQRDLVSDGYDEALAIIAAETGLTVHEYATGTECFTWIIPEKWTCRRAELANMDGTVLLSTDEHPLHAMSYSLPLDAEVERQTLLDHLHVHPKLADSIPFMFKYYARDWGLCCSRRFKESLTDHRYRVRIDAEFTPGTLKVGDWVLPGTDEHAGEYVLCAHLCHPHQFNDGLSGVVAGLEVMHRLAQAGPLRHSFRLIICSETIGSAAWLAHNEHLVPDMRGGIFLEMLALPHAHALQHSNFPDSPTDRTCLAVMREHDPDSWADGFPKVILNDERMFNSPGIKVPMTSLSRVLPRTEADFPFRGYHSDKDTVANADMDGLRDSIDLVEKMLLALERTEHGNAEQTRVASHEQTPLGPVPFPLWKGELFCSRYRAIDYAAMKHCIHSVPYAMNGRRDVAQVAAAAGQPLDEVRRFLDALETEGLLEYREASA